MRASIGFPLRSPSRLAGTLALLFCVGAAWAGFDSPAGVPDACKRYDGEPLGRAGTYPQTTIDKLKAKYGIGDAAAKAKIDAMRKNIEKAKDLVAAQDAAIGQCLKDACASGRLCIDFKSTNAYASTLPDGTKDCKKDKVNVGVDKAGCAEFECWDPNLYWLFTSLLHEGKHMIQDYAVAVANDPVNVYEVEVTEDAAAAGDCKATVKKKKKSACNEIEAAELENGVIDMMKGPLKKIAEGMPPGPLPRGAAGMLIMFVQSAPDPKKAAKDMLDAICKNKQGNDNHIACQKERKAAFDTFLASGGTAADKKAMNDAIKKTRWFTIFPNNPNWGPITAVTTGGSTGGKVEQTTGSTSQTLDTGLLRATDVYYVAEHVAIVAGVDAGETGVLLLYLDRDQDALLDADSRTELVVSDLLRGGIALTPDPSSGDLLAFGAEDNEVYRLQDLDGDGIPETLSDSPATAVSANLENIYALDLSDGGRELYGRLFGNDDAFADAEMVRFSDTDGDGFFESETVLNVAATTVFSTAFVGMPEDGQWTAELSAPSLAFVEVWCVDEGGRTLQFLGDGQANARGTVTVSFPRSLMLGDLVATRDLVNGIVSQPVEVQPSGSSTLVPDVPSLSATTGGAQALAFDGGRELAGQGYLLLGSLSGTIPGFELAGLHVPLTPDAYTAATLELAGSGPFVNTSGTLDDQGRATAGVRFGPLAPAVVGRGLYHAMVVFGDNGPLFVSNPVVLTVTP